MPSSVHPSHAGHPLDTMKVRMVLMPPPTPKFMDMARDILAKEGIVGLYAGVASPALGAMAHKASVFLSYGIAKQVVSVLFGPYKMGGVTVCTQRYTTVRNIQCSFFCPRKVKLLFVNPPW